MEIEEKNKKLTVRLFRDLNLLAARRILSMSREAEEVLLDFEKTNIVDSEGVILIFKLIKKGKKVVLRKPPEILHEIWRILFLEDVIDLKKLTSEE